MRHAFDCESRCHHLQCDFAWLCVWFLRVARSCRCREPSWLVAPLTGVFARHARGTRPPGPQQQRGVVPSAGAFYSKFTRRLLERCAPCALRVSLCLHQQGSSFCLYQGGGSFGLHQDTRNFTRDSAGHQKNSPSKRNFIWEKLRVSLGLVDLSRCIKPDSKWGFFFPGGPSRHGNGQHPHHHACTYVML